MDNKFIMRQCHLFMFALSNIKSFPHFFIEFAAHAAGFLLQHLSRRSLRELGAAYA